MSRFGGWSQYRAAPARIVEEQIIEWSAQCQADYDTSKEAP